MNKLILTAFLTVATASAFAADPVRISGNERGDSVYAYTDTLAHGELQSGTKARQIWLLTNYGSSIGTRGETILSEKALVTFDCAGRREGAARISYYSERGGRGRMVLSDDRGQPIKQVVPDTMAEGTLTAVCSL